MPYLAALAAASALYYYLKTPPSSVTHTQAVAHSGGDMGDNPDLTGQDLARLYLDQLDAQHSALMGEYGGVPGSYSGAGVSAAGVPVSSSPSIGDYTGGGYGSSYAPPPSSSYAGGGPSGGGGGFVPINQFSGAAQLAAESAYGLFNAPAPTAAPAHGSGAV